MTKEVNEIRTGKSKEELREYIYEHVYPKIEAASVLMQRELEDDYCNDWFGFTLSYYVDMEEFLNEAGERLPECFESDGWPLTMRTTRVKNWLLDQIGLDAEKLEECAVRNIGKAYRVVTMQQMLMEMLGVSGEMMPDESEMQMIVLTNNTGMYGAAALMSEKAIKDIQQALGEEEFVILPSSIHEVIAVPYMGSMSDMTSMVQQVNTDQVAVDERLADTAFLYKDGKIMTAA